MTTVHNTVQHGGSPWPAPPISLPGNCARQGRSRSSKTKITELWGYLNAATSRFLALVAEFDREKAFERHGLANTAQWLNWQCGIGAEAAREKVRVARALEQLPEIADAFAKGELSYSKVRAMTRVATAANESVLCTLRGTGRPRTSRSSRGNSLDAAARRREARAATARATDRFLFFDMDGQFVLNARLPPEIGTVVCKALELAVEALRPLRSRTCFRGNSAADRGGCAAGRRAAAHRRAVPRRHGEDSGAGSSADRVQVVVHIDQAILSEQQAAAEDGPHSCELEDGPALALDTARRLACDATVIGLIEGNDGEPIDIGRKTRSIPAAISRALKARDGGCRFPGCDRTRFTEGHHVKHWANGGETNSGTS